MDGITKADDGLFTIKYKCYTEEYDQEVNVTKEVPIHNIEPRITEGTYGAFMDGFIITVDDCPVCLKEHKVFLKF